MSEEKRRVLEMLEAGKISGEDALRLLEALGESGETLVQEEAPVPQASESPEAPTERTPDPVQDAPAPAKNGPEGAVGPGAEENGGSPAQEQPAGSAPRQGQGVDASFHQAMKDVRAEVGEAVAEAGKALSQAADEALAAMSKAGETGKAVGKPVPKLTLWPETPMGAPLEEPSLPPAPPAGPAPQGKYTGTPEHALARPLPVEGAPYPYSGVPLDIKQIDIDWINGPVEVRSWNGETVNVTEYAKRPLDYGQQLELTVSDGTLRIRWTRERGFWKGMLLSKHLVVEVPAGTRLEKVKVQNVSGGISAAELRGESVSLSSTSGGVEAVGIAAESLKLSSVSGAARVEGVSAGALSVDTTSGRMEASGFEAEKVKLNTVSGSLTACGNAEKFQLNSVSGSIDLKVGQCPEKAKLESVSGRVSLTLPENEGFTVKYNSMSGAFHSDFPLSGNLGKRSGKAVYGLGEVDLALNTMSGGMELHRA